MKAIAYGAASAAGLRATGFTGDHMVVGRVEAVDPVWHGIGLATPSGERVEVTVMPLTALRSRRRRGLAWSETKTIRLSEIAVGARVVVRGTLADDGVTVRATSVLVGDISRFACGTVAGVDAARGEVTIGFADAETVTAVLSPSASVREIDAAQRTPPSDEETVDRLSTPRELWCLSPGDFVLALLEPSPPGQRPYADKIVKLPPASRWR